MIPTRREVRAKAMAMYALDTGGRHPWVRLDAYVREAYCITAYWRLRLQLRDEWTVGSALPCGPHPPTNPLGEEVSYPIMPEQAQHDPTQAVKPRRNRRSAKKAGASFERLVADYLKTALDDDRIDRRVKNGAKDRGDIAGVRTIRGGRVVIEAKNTRTVDLSGWVREAAVEAGNDDAPIGVVVHKRHGKGQPEDQYVTMTLATFAALLLGGPDDLKGI